MSEWEPMGMWEDYDQEFDETEDEVTFQAVFKHQTDKAYLVEMIEVEAEHWIPKSQVADIDGEFIDGQPIVGEIYEITIPSWLAEKKEI